MESEEDREARHNAMSGIVIAIPPEEGKPQEFRIELCDRAKKLQESNNKKEQENDR